MTSRSKLYILYIASFIATIAPLAIYVLINKGKYISTVSDSIKLSVGFIMCACLMLLKVIGKLKIPSRIGVYSVVFVLSYLLDAILEDLIVLSFLALLGEIIDAIFFQIPIRRLKESIHNDKIADATTKQIEGVFKQYFRGADNE